MPYSARQLKIAGLLLLVVPLLILALFALGELIGNAAGGLIHLVQAAPLAGLTALAWFKPRLGGAILLVVGLTLTVMYPLTVRGFPIGALIVTDLTLFGPTVLAGALFLVAAGRERHGAPTT